MANSSTAPLSNTERNRLRWRCRRGLLENEIIINRWLDKHLHAITAAEVHALGLLLDLSDNDLLDLLLGKKQPQPPLNTEAVRQLLHAMQQRPSQAKTASPTGTTPQTEP